MDSYQQSALFSAKHLQQRSPVRVALTNLSARFASITILWHNAAPTMLGEIPGLPVLTKRTMRRGKGPN